MYFFAIVQSVYWVDLTFALFIAVGGFVAGLCLNYRSSRRAAAETLRARTALRRMHDLATSVAADVGEHHSRVQEINTELSAARDGDQLDEVVVSSLNEIVAANERLQSRLADAETKLQQQAEEIETQSLVARTDQLTQLWNRRAFDDELGRRFAEWHRRETPFSLLMLDVDHFKKFNDSHGHQAGDEVLRSVAKALAGAMRELDLPARYGGEEFAVVLPTTNLQDALRAAERAHRAISENTCSVGDKKLKVTASIGVSTILRSDNAATVVQRADEALYAAKRGGRNCICYHDGAATVSYDATAVEACKPLAAPVNAPIAVSQDGPRTAEAEPVPPTQPNSAKRTSAPTKQSGNSPIDFTDCETFASELGRRLLEFQRFQAQLSLLVLSVDNFQEEIAELGPESATLLSRTVFEFLKRSLQGMAVLAETTEGRFLALLPGTDLKTAAKLGERFRRAISSGKVPLGNRQLQISVSIGLAQAAEGDDPQSFVRRADEALHASHEAGGNCSHFEENGRCKAATPLAAAC
jgi:diguanylate cyclase